jgi:hypothetical protein
MAEKKKDLAKRQRKHAADWKAGRSRSAGHNADVALKKRFDRELKAVKAEDKARKKPKALAIGRKSATRGKGGKGRSKKVNS